MNNKKKRVSKKRAVQNRGYDIVKKHTQSKRQKNKNINLTDFNQQLRIKEQQLRTANQQLRIAWKKAQESRKYAENIVDTMRESLLVLDKDLKVISANRTFYETFKVKPNMTEGKFIYDLGNRQWNISMLRELLEKILPKNKLVNNFEVEHNFETIGYRIMLLNARGIYIETKKPHMILLAIEDITKQRAAEEELKLYATTDMMTGVLNRRTGLIFLETQIKLLHRHKNVITVCFIDINGLKKVNDRYGHSEGDWLITSFVNILKKSIRESDIICRLGGDEFLIIFENCAINDAKNIFAKVHKKVDETNIKAKKPFKINFSYGFAECNPDKKMSVEGLLAIADKKMYNNKTKFKEQLKK